MQDLPVDPAVKAELTRCIAAHRALKSFTAVVQVTTRGLPRPRSGTVQIALERPGRLRMEAQGPLRALGTCLLVGSSGYVYEASSPKKTYHATALPIEASPLEFGLAESDMLILPTFAEIMAQKDGLETLLEKYPTVTVQRETVIGALPLQVFRLENKLTRQILRFGQSDRLLRQIVLTQSNIEIREDYRSLRVNPRLPESLWDFAVPAGFRDQNAPRPALPPPPKLGPKAVITSSGLQYLDLKKGDGIAAATGTTVVAHYTGFLTDGSQFDSSYGKAPMTLKLPAQVIAGWNEGLLGMRPGGKRKLIIPAKLGYGEAGAGGVIPPNTTLIFEIEVLSVEAETRG